MSILQQVPEKMRQIFRLMLDSYQTIEDDTLTVRGPWAYHHFRKNPQSTDTTSYNHNPTSFITSTETECRFTASVVYDGNQGDSVSPIDVYARYETAGV